MMGSDQGVSVGWDEGLIWDRRAGGGAVERVSPSGKPGELKALRHCTS